MLSSFVLNVAPLVLISLFIVLLAGESLWRFSVSKPETSDLNSGVVKVTYSIMLTLLMTSLVYTIFNGAAASPFSLQRVEMIVANILLICCGIYLNTGSSAFKEQRADGAVFIGFSYIVSVFLFQSTNLITLFFSLELINTLVLYSFLLTSKRSLIAGSNAGAGISSSCVYQFILNFFSSIVLFAGINAYIMHTGGSDITHAYVWSESDNVKSTVGIILGAFLIKFGTGPWIFFKINIYKNMNLGLILLYSSFYLGIVFPFFLNLMLVYGLRFIGLSYYVAVALMISAAYVFASASFNTTNLFVFISFSSLFNFITFVVQAMVACSVFE